mmetsp:Transcript_24670/g.38366  ORF Transcript_24670/g.38366 Transcript_24670/m.38366 type:complete len:154 (+) Transcript_24670:46-507(+)
MFRRLVTTSIRRPHGVLTKPTSRLISQVQLSGLQLNNSMFVTKTVLDQQVDIMKNPNLPVQLKQSDDYVYRHIGNSDKAVSKQLEFLNVTSIEELMDEVVPEKIRLSSEDRFNHNGRTLDSIDSETLMLERIRQFSHMNIVNKSFIGQGFYST